MINGQQLGSYGILTFKQTRATHTLLHGLCGWFSNRFVLHEVRSGASTRCFLFLLLHDMWLCICLQITSNYDMQMCQHMVMGLVISVSSALWPLAPYLW